MTAYSGNAITVQPNAAVFYVDVTRTQTGTQGVYTLTLSGTFASGNKINVDGTEVTLDSSSAASPTAAATATKNAMSANTNYTVTSSNAVITFTEKAGHYGTGMPAWSITSTAGKGTAATTTQGVPTEAHVDSPTTFVDRNFVLHAGDDLKSGDSIFIEAISTYINPSGSTTVRKANTTVAVS